MAPSEHVSPDTGSRWATVVGAILEEARRRAGKGPALALKLQQLGVVGERGEPYSESSISNWIRGRAKPPAEVVLAAAQLSDISLDERLGIGRKASGLERQVADLRGQVDVLKTQMQGLLGRSADAGVTTDASRLLNEVQEGLRSAASELGLRWAEIPADSVGERLAGILQARMVDVRANLGLDWDSPSGDAEHVALELSRQMDEVRRRLAERRGRDAGSERRQVAN